MIANILISFFRTFLFFLRRMPKISKNPHFLWEVSRFGRHPHHYRGVLGFLLELSNFWVIILFIVSHIIFAVIFSTQIEIIQELDSSAHSEYNFWDKIYFSLINQISPGFTEYLPSTTRTQVILVVQSFLGAIFNALLFALIVAKLFFPGEAFEFSRMILHDPARNALVIRMYSKYPGTVFDLDIKFFRFMIGRTIEKKSIGRQEEIPIMPSKRMVLKKNYGLLLRIPLLKEEVEWNTDVRDLDLEGMPFNWFQNFEQTTGHFFLAVSAESQTGKIYQVQHYYLTPDTFKCGRHQLFNKNIELDVNSWYDYTTYDWKTWNAFDDVSCLDCTLPNCLKKHDEN